MASGLRGKGQGVEFSSACLKRNGKFQFINIIFYFASAKRNGFITYTDIVSIQTNRFEQN